MSLITDIESNLISGLLKTNLFSPSSPYDINDPKYQQVAGVVGQAIIGGSFNFSNTILGRALGPNTPIEKIGNYQLTQEFARRVGGQLRHNILPSVDVNKLFDGDSSNNSNIITKPNYWKITPTQQNTFSQILSILTGFEGMGNPFPFGATTEEYLRNTGQGSLDKIRNATLKNEFKPDFKIGSNGKIDTKLENTGYGETLNNPPQTALETSNKVDGGADFGTFDGTDNGWKPTSLNPSVFNGLLYFTQQIVNRSQLNNNFVASDKGDIIGNNINTDTKAYRDKKTGEEISKGRNLKNEDGSYCRVWTKSQPYDKYENSIRHRTSDNPKLKTKTVLSDNGTLRIAPTNNGDLKKLMFSIENLAFAGSTSDLKECEVGFGTNGNRGVDAGRIMWFPPYELSINEQASANWDSVNFIGRNEPIYTYNGAERSATIGFKLIVDYPSNLKNLTGELGERLKAGNYDKFFAGCVIVPQREKGLTSAEKTQLEVAKQDAQPIQQTVVNQIPTAPYSTTPLPIYFDNDSFTVSETLIDNGGSTVVTNSGLSATTSTLADYLTGNDGKKFKIKLIGRASALNNSSANLTLSNQRTEAVKTFLLNYLGSLDSTEYSSSNSKERWSLTSRGEEDAINKNSTKDTIVQDAIDRRVDLFLEFNPKLNVDNKSVEIDGNAKATSQQTVDDIQETLNKSNTSTNFGECAYFQELKQTDPFLLEKYSEKIKYFSTAFHSQTPEDFNSRLNFLHQCTRQGRLANLSNDDVKNSIFGATPVCILRIGDFFNTKIIIENIQFNYEPLLWDLNPEGVGVQPMLCDVTISCKVIGGQSLDRPLERLQNALSFNYYANSTVYKNLTTTDTTASDPNLIAPSGNNSLIKKAVSNPSIERDQQKQAKK